LKVGAKYPVRTKCSGKYLAEHWRGLCEKLHLMSIINDYHKHNFNCEVNSSTTYIIHEAEEKSMQIVALKPLDFKQIGNFFNS
jgi:hypothetical protein